MPHTREDFIALMKAFHVPDFGRLTEYARYRINDFEFFTSIDYTDRLSVNIPVRATHPDGGCSFQTLVVYQVKPGSHLFATATTRSPKKEEYNSLLRSNPDDPDDELDLLKLAFLLAGGSVKIYAKIDNQDSYVTLSKYDTSTLPD